MKVEQSGAGGKPGERER